MKNCAVCLSVDGFPLKLLPSKNMWTIYYDCPVCGYFSIDDDLAEDFLGEDSKKATRRIRATLSHWIRQNQNKSQDTLNLHQDTYQDAVDGKIGLPTPAKAALSIVGYVGDAIQKTGEKLPGLPAQFSAEIGTTTRQAAIDLIRQLEKRGLVSFHNSNTLSHYDVVDLDLTLEGWELYQSEQSGQQTAGYGFLAMKFNDEQLEMLTQQYLKPAILELGFPLVDMRDVAEPGLIDNIMRVRIRDANFVIVDLTHDNSGAYWEAGFAEGLGKPVLYICEKQKFAEKQTHFDTNHCTTVMWSSNDPNGFCEELIATLRRAVPSM